VLGIIVVVTLPFQRWASSKARRPRYRLTRSIFLRGMGVAYLAAFGSLAAQVDGLIGSRGILPAASYLVRAKQVLGARPATYWQLPTLLWLNASDRALHALCWGGLALSVALVAGLVPGFSAALLWLFYLSLAVAGQEFLHYQWDSLLLEAGLLAVLLAPWGVRLSRARDEPPRLPVWLVHWLVFRLMFLSGAVKLRSGDPTWWDWSALDYHYETQPLPTWTSWLIYQMPAWFHRLSVAFMFYAELIAPCFVFAPRPVRLVGLVSLVLLQFLIAGTGNYGFFNLLAVVLCLSLLEDRDWQWLRRAPGRWQRPRLGLPEIEDSPVPATNNVLWSRPRRIAVSLVGAIIIAVTGAQTIEIVWPAAILPAELDTLSQWVAPLRSTNPYGLFAVMTTKRPEIMVEGSNDGVTWKPYRFRWKPCELDRRPRFTTPHLPRLDWQMWFAALEGDCRSPFQSWFLRFEERLLEGAPEVLGLLRENPFPTRPPRYVRARSYLYKFTQWGSADWWAREELGLFCPPLERRMAGGSE
jgi:hypothetical protein